MSCVCGSGKHRYNSKQYMLPVQCNTGLSPVDNHVGHQTKEIYILKEGRGVGVGVGVGAVLKWPGENVQ